MEKVDERYISLLTDFGFKRIFGSSPQQGLAHQLSELPL